MDSNVDFVQTQRFLKITSPLGDSALLFTGLEGSEVISSPFIFRVTVYTQAADSKVLSLLGKSATLSIGNGQEAPRLFNGLFRKLSGPTVLTRDYKTWRAEIVPQMAFLAYTSDCRIFQSKTVVQIITAVLDTHGIQHYEFRSMMGSYPVLDYCVQYRESALNFISRLMEHFGIYYWFEHDETSHTLVMSDSAVAAKPLLPDVFTMPDQDQNAAIITLEADFAFRPGTWTLKDYDFVNPDSPMLASTPTVVNTAPLADYEIFEFPGSFDDAGAGSDISRVRIEQEESQYHRMRGTGTCRDASPGRQITIAAPDGAGGHTDTTLLLVETFHHATDLTQVLPEAGSGTYANEFTGVPTTYNYRPERVSQKPFVQGVQTARVTGPAGQKIYTDSHGRVKVRFHWDRNPDGDADEASSCWLRVSQIWSSGVGGGIQVPRVGEEVIVDFLEGDPDRPIITGRVYNGNNTTPYGLPGNQTQFGFKTQSIPSGGFHELRFEDKAGSEEIYFQSQKDFNRKVLNDETDNIGGNATRNITGNLDHTTTGTESRTISQTFTKKVVGTETRTNMDNVSHTINGTHTKVIMGAESHTSSTSMTILSPQQLSTINEMIENAPTSKTANSPYVISTIGYNIGAYGMAESVTGQATQVFGENTQICGFNNQINILDCSTNISETENTVAKIEEVASHIKTAAIRVESGAMAVINKAIQLFS
jgi:type VI secretion system secreted protein VgrG